MEATTPKFQGGHLFLEVYIAGPTPAGLRAVTNLELLCAEVCPDGAYEIKVIDIAASPDIADKHAIMATPTVVRRAPPPMKRIIGDLTDRDVVMQGLMLLVG